MKDKIITVIKIILIIILAVSLFRIYKYNSADKEFEESTKEVQEKFQTIDEIVKEKVDKKKLAQEELEKKEIEKAYQNEVAKEKIKALKEEYKSIVGWITIPETKIDYPIVKTKDNDFYLDHNYKNQYNVFGAIYMDFRNSEDFSDQNTIIYGHNNKRGGNFKELHLYEEEGFFEKSKYIEILSEEGLKKYKIFAAYNANPLDKFRSPEYSEDDEKNLIEYIKEKNILKEEIPHEFKNILTLQTCSPGNTRFVLQGVLVEE